MDSRPIPRIFGHEISANELIWTSSWKKGFGLVVQLFCVSAKKSGRIRLKRMSRVVFFEIFSWYPQQPLDTIVCNGCFDWMMIRNLYLGNGCFTISIHLKLVGFRVPKPFPKFLFRNWTLKNRDLWDLLGCWVTSFGRWNSLTKKGQKKRYYTNSRNCLVRKVPVF